MEEKCLVERNAAGLERKLKVGTFSKRLVCMLSFPVF